jgi:hypothetical protein
MPGDYRLIAVPGEPTFCQLRRSRLGSIAPISNNVPDTQLKSHFLYLVIGLFFLIAATIPYVVSNKIPDDGPAGIINWNNRSNLLIAFPMALIIYAIFSIIGKKLSVPSRFIRIFLYGVAIAGCLAQIETSLWLHAKGITDESLIINLKKSKASSDVYIYGIVDNVGLFTNLPITWPYIFRHVYSDNIWRIGIPETWVSQKVNSGQKYSSDFIRSLPTHMALHKEMRMPFGLKQATLIINKGSILQVSSTGWLVLRYLFYKYSNPKELEKFLVGVTQIEIIAKNPQ